MWICLLAGWVIGSAALYAYLIKTAREPRNEECMDCERLDCAECPLVARREDETALRRAA